MSAMGSTTRLRIVDAAAITVAGVIVAASPALWATIVWPELGGVSSPGWLLVFAFSVAPFALAAVLRGAGLADRVGGVLTTLGAAALVVLGQVAGLDPNDPSSTASIALVVVPVYAVLAVLVIWGAETAAAALVQFWRSPRA